MKTTGLPCILRVKREDLPRVDFRPSSDSIAFSVRLRCCIMGSLGKSWSKMNGQTAEFRAIYAAGATI